MSSYGVKEWDMIQMLLDIGRYEEALGIPIRYSMKQLHMAHMTLQKSYENDPGIREALSNAYNLLKSEKPRQKGIRLHRLGYFSESIAILQEIANVMPDSEICLVLGDAYFRAGDYPSALPFLEFISDTVNNPKYWYYLGLCFESTGQCEKALYWLEKAADKGEEDAYYDTGKLLVERGEYAKSLNYLNKDLGVRQNPDTMLLVGISCYYCGNFDEGLRNLKILIQIRPTIDAYHYYARILIRTKHRGEAISLLKSLVDKANRAADHHLLGTLLLEEKSCNAALESLKKAVDIRGDLADYIWYGKGLCQCERYQEAIWYLESGLKIKHDSTGEQWLHYAKTKIKKGL